jgi:spore coat polysaccharide biosynthesis protein SpsF
MKSTRLPNKVMQDLAGEPMLVRVVTRVGRASSLDLVVVATTIDPADDAIESLCAQRGIACFRGSEEDVLDRYYQAARAFGANVVVRVSSDCPVIDPGVIDQLVNGFLDRQPDVDYANISVPKRTFPMGLDAEVMKYDALRQAWEKDKNPAWREHVTPFIYRNPEDFRIWVLTHEPDLSHLRWTVDTSEDLALARLVYDHFKHDHFAWREVYDLVQAHPEWATINAHVKQRGVA